MLASKKKKKLLDYVHIFAACVPFSREKFGALAIKVIVPWAYLVSLRLSLLDNGTNCTIWTTENIQRLLI